MRLVIGEGYTQTGESDPDWRKGKISTRYRTLKRKRLTFERLFEINGGNEKLLCKNLIINGYYIMLPYLLYQEIYVKQSIMCQRYLIFVNLSLNLLVESVFYFLHTFNKNNVIKGDDVIKLMNGLTHLLIAPKFPFI